MKEKCIVVAAVLSMLHHEERTRKELLHPSSWKQVDTTRKPILSSMLEKTFYNPELSISQVFKVSPDWKPDYCLPIVFCISCLYCKKITQAKSLEITRYSSRASSYGNNKPWHEAETGFSSVANCGQPLLNACDQKNPILRSTQASMFVKNPWCCYQSWPIFFLSFLSLSCKGLSVSLLLKVWWLSGSSAALVGFVMIMQQR